MSSGIHRSVCPPTDGAEPLAGLNLGISVNHGSRLEVETARNKKAAGTSGFLTVSLAIFDVFRSTSRRETSGKVISPDFFRTPVRSRYVCAPCFNWINTFATGLAISGPVCDRENLHNPRLSGRNPGPRMSHGSSIVPTRCCGL